MTREPFIAHSELTNEIYIIVGKEKYCVTEQVIKAVKATKALEQESVLDKIRAEIEEKYGNYDICEWFEDYDYEETDISEYRSVGDVSDILAIIDKYRAEGSDKE